MRLLIRLFLTRSSQSKCWLSSHCLRNFPSFLASSPQWISSHTLSVGSFMMHMWYLWDQKHCESATLGVVRIGCILMIASLFRYFITHFCTSCTALAEWYVSLWYSANRNCFFQQRKPQTLFMNYQSFKPLLF